MTAKNSDLICRQASRYDCKKLRIAATSECEILRLQQPLKAAAIETLI
ncbi:MAG: hypothetical protein KKE11_01355 [Gammaproteobacteria bacterium]|nr:hypothetical protein [Gammaproteobacteria bacterium]